MKKTEMKEGNQPQIVRSTMGESPEATGYAVRLSELAITARSLVRDLDPKNDLTFLRVTCKVYDMMIAPDRDYYLIVVQCHKELGVGVKKSSGLRSHHHRPLWAGGDSPSSDDRPILAAVTVPLSSVNIEDDDEANNEADEGDGPGARYAPAAGGLDKKGTWKHKTTRDGASSTNVTIPLRMVSCRSAPMGSISLKITIKVPSADERKEHAARNVNRTTTSSGSSMPMSALAKPDIQVETTFDKNGDETKVNESIELGPLTRFMDTWSLGSGAAQPPSSSSKENDGKKESGKSATATAAAKAKSQKKNRKPTTPRRRENKSDTERNKQQETKHKNLRWSKQFDHKSKKWSAFNNSSGGGGGAAEAAAAAPPPTRKKEEETSANNSGNNEGWFAFLSSQHAG